MKKNTLNLVASFALFIFFSNLISSQNRPNIVIIFADDLGYSSISPYGAPSTALETPALTDMANDGRKFLNAYTPTSMCSPSRYGLMSGRYYWRDVRDWGIIENSDDCTLVRNRYNLASRLKNEGYNTGGFGKWHMGYDRPSSVPYNIPNYVGFDYWHDYRVRPNGTRIDDEEDADRFRTGEYLDNEVAAWLNNQSRETPFFLYFAPISIHSPYIPNEAYQGASAAGDPYTDYIMELDGSVGKVLDILEDKGLDDNTIVIFTSDNGSVTGHTRELREDPSINFIASGLYGDDNEKFEGSKLRIHEAGFKVPMIVKWPNRIPAGTSSTELVNVIDIYASLMEALSIQMQAPEYEASDSYSFYPAWFYDLDEPIRDNMIVNSFEGIRAVYADGWKYIDGVVREPTPYRFFNSRREEREAHEQLYNLSNDPFEDNDLVGRISQRSRVADMKNLLENIADQGYSRPAYTLSTKSIEDNAKNVFIYPNPVADFIQVSNLTEKKNGAIYNILGAKIKDVNIANNEKIDVRELNGGLYFLRFNDTKKTMRFLKK